MKRVIYYYVLLYRIRVEKGIVGKRNKSLFLNRLLRNNILSIESLRKRMYRIYNKYVLFFSSNKSYFLVIIIPARRTFQLFYLVYSSDILLLLHLTTWVYIHRVFSKVIKYYIIKTLKPVRHRWRFIRSGFVTIYFQTTHTTSWKLNCLNSSKIQ